MRRYGHMVRRTGLALVCLSLATGCFNPDDAAVDTDTDAGSSGGSSGNPTTDPTSGPSTSGPGTTTDDGSTTNVDPTVAETGSTGPEPTGGEEVPDWGEGEAPDFGDLGDEGEGAVLAVHALDIEDDVDVWLVGQSEPAATGIAPGRAVRLEGVARDAHRVVFARAGTQEAVGCSEWFPLRAEEQWATVAARSEHDCTASGETPTFEQSLALDGNTVRFVHAATPDSLSITRAGVPEPGTLEPGDTLEGSDLPDCETSGCSVPYAVGSPGIGAPRHIRFATAEVSDVPPPGEVLFVVQGDLRQDWPNEADSMQMLAVNIEGDSRRLLREPEIAFAAPDAPEDVVFSVLAPPTIVDIATVPPCFPGPGCEMETLRFTAGEQEIFANGPEGSANGMFELEDGERYVLVYTPNGQLLLVRDAFSRTDVSTAMGRGMNWTDGLLTLGRVFGGTPQPFPGMEDMPPGTISEATEIPDGSWGLLTSSGGNPLLGGCWASAFTEVPWRGFLWSRGQFDMDSWPPRISPLGIICT